MNIIFDRLNCLREKSINIYIDIITVYVFNIEIQISHVGKEEILILKI